MTVHPYDTDPDSIPDFVFPDPNLDPGLVFNNGHISASLLQSNSGADTLTICLAGILVRNAEMFFSPVRSVLERLGDVLHVSYTNPNGFDGDATAGSLAELLNQLSAWYRHINVIGVSLGGMLLAAPELTWSLNTINKNRQLQLVVHDSASGSRDFYGINRQLAPLVRLIPDSKRSEPRVTAFARNTLVPPQPGQLEPWQDGAYSFLGSNTTRQNRFERTIAFAMNGMHAALESSAHCYVDQVDWMSRFKLPYDALDGINVAYIANGTYMNRTLRQPQAASTWAARTGAVIYYADGPHASLAQWPVEHGNLFDKLLLGRRLARIVQKVWRVSQIERPAISVIMISSYQCLRRPPPGQYYPRSANQTPQ